MRKIIFKSSKFALVSDEDYDELNEFTWYEWNGYAARTQYLGKRDGKYKYRVILMHREILDPPTGVYCDHINSNRLDNRRENIRLCNRRENTLNTSIRSDNTSGYKGVGYNKRCVKRPWFASIKISGRQKILGYFESRIEAAATYNQAALTYFGEFAKLNVIKESSFGNKNSQRLNRRIKQPSVHSDRNELSSD